MLEHKVKNLNIKCGGEDYLVNGKAFYVVEDYDEDGKEACFESSELTDALGKDGYVLSKECLSYIQEATVIHLNNDNYLCRSLGHKI